MGKKRNPLKSCLIIGAAPCSEFSYIRTFSEIADCVICADGGAAVAEVCGIKPDFWIGDGDSLSCMTNTENCFVLPCEKDYTDLHCAVDLAIEKDCRILYLCAVTGGRLDHFLANLCLLEYIADHDAIGVLADGQNICFLHQGGEMVLERQEAYQYISVIPLDRELCGVTLKGLKYSLDNAVLHREIPIGVSNEPVSDRFSVEITSGRALIVYSKDVSK